jgi:hypothetical protein
MSQRLVKVVFVLAAAALWQAGVSGQAPHPLNGTWRLNLAKSKYSPASLAPKSTTAKWVVAGDSATVTVDSVDSQGRTVHTEYTAKFDGKDYPWRSTIDGKPNLTQDAVSLRRIDDYTYEIVNKLKGQVLTTQRTVISRDGKSRTNTVTGKMADGTSVNHTVVFERQ